MMKKILAASKNIRKEMNILTSQNAKGDSIRQVGLTETPSCCQILFE